MSEAAKKMEPDMIPVFIMGKRYRVPAELTIMKALEYAGYQYIRGAGCRGGICGACATVFRREGDYKIYSGLACQTVVEPNMHLTQIPFYPALRQRYDYATVEPIAESIHQLYPEVFRCLACNACTKICPMDVEVLDYISAIKQGNLEKATRISFDCIQCGLCTSRCMAEMPQYHLAQLARRLYGGKLAPKAVHLKKTVDDIAAGKFGPMLKDLMGMDADKLREVYSGREMEPAMSDESWMPKENVGL